MAADTSPCCMRAARACALRTERADAARRSPCAYRGVAALVAVLTVFGITVAGPGGGYVTLGLRGSSSRGAASGVDAAAADAAEELGRVRYDDELEVLDLPHDLPPRHTTPPPSKRGAAKTAPHAATPRAKAKPKCLQRVRGRCVRVPVGGSGSSGTAAAGDVENAALQDALQKAGYRYPFRDLHSHNASALEAARAAVSAVDERERLAYRFGPVLRGPRALDAGGAAADDADGDDAEGDDQQHDGEPDVPFHLVVASDPVSVPDPPWLYWISLLRMPHARAFVYHRSAAEPTPAPDSDLPTPAVPAGWGTKTAWGQALDAPPHLPPGARGRLGVSVASVHHHVLLPNHGREAAAFLHHVVTHWDALIAEPRTLVAFAHTGGPYDWHSSCETLIPRLHAAYDGRNGRSGWRRAVQRATTHTQHNATAAAGAAAGAAATATRARDRIRRWRTWPGAVFSRFATQMTTLNGDPFRLGRKRGELNWDAYCRGATLSCVADWYCAFKDDWRYTTYGCDGAEDDQALGRPWRLAPPPLNATFVSAIAPDGQPVTEPWDVRRARHYARTMHDTAPMPLGYGDTHSAARGFADWDGNTRARYDALIQRFGVPPRLSAAHRDHMRRLTDAADLRDTAGGSSGSWSCCAQFVLPAWRITQHPKQLYEELLQYVTDARGEDWLSGRVLEWSWYYLWDNSGGVTPTRTELWDYMLVDSALRLENGKFAPPDHPPYAPPPAGASGSDTADPRREHVLAADAYDRRRALQVSRAVRACALIRERIFVKSLKPD